MRVKCFSPSIASCVAGNSISALSEDQFYFFLNLCAVQLVAIVLKLSNLSLNA